MVRTPEGATVFLTPVPGVGSFDCCPVVCATLRPSATI
jgi:hypothetical protein